MKRVRVMVVVGIGLVACMDDSVSDGDSSGPDPVCPFERIVDVHFGYQTASAIESGTCGLTYFGALPGDANNNAILLTTDCGYEVELDGVSPPAMELAAGEIVELETLVDGPEDLGCAESGWLVIRDEQGRMALTVASVLTTAPPLPLGDLGELELAEGIEEGCSALRLRALGDEVSVFPATSTEVELAGARLLVQLGPFNRSSANGCGAERYSLALFRLPD